MSFESEYVTVEQRVKVWWKSRTIWFNSFLASAPILLSQLSDNVPSLQPYIPHNLYGILFVLGVVGNMWLRFNTTVAIKKS